MRTMRLCVRPGITVATTSDIPEGFGLCEIRFSALSMTGMSPGSSPSDQYNPDSPSHTACFDMSCPKLVSSVEASCLMAIATVTPEKTIWGKNSKGMETSVTGSPVKARSRRATTSAGSPCIALYLLPTS